MAKKKVTDVQTAPVAFVVMGFDGRLDHIYYRVVKPVLEGCGFECKRGDELHKLGIIVDQLRTEINNAALVLGDLTFENPNVFYEIGIAHILKRPTILISQSPADIPFDVTHWRVIAYEDTKLGLLDLRDELVKYLTYNFEIDQKTFKERPLRDYSITIDELEIQRAALFSNSVDFKRYAIKFLGEYGDQLSFDKIEMIALGDSNPDVVRDAYTALHKIDHERARPLLLENGLRKQPNFLVRERVVSLLGSLLPDEDLLEQMFAQLGDDSWGVREAVCQVLGRWEKLAATGPLQRMLSDSESRVRLTAAEALQRLQQVERKKSKRRQ